MQSQDTVHIQVYAGKGIPPAYAIVDPDDYAWASLHRWMLSDAGYAKRRIQEDGRRRHYFLHRLILGLTHGDGLEGDHINRDRLDCRRSNLRIVTKKQNRQNKSPYQGGTSPRRGVHWDTSRGKWAATIGVDGQKIALGWFDSELEAAVTARLARAKLMPYAID